MSFRTIAMLHTQNGHPDAQLRMPKAVQGRVINQLQVQTETHLVHSLHL